MIYTGGTIGMLVSSRGYIPEPYFLTDTLRSQKRFHDPLQDSLYSNAASVEGYREWSTSGKSSPISSTKVPTVGPGISLLVRSSRPVGKISTLSPSIFSQVEDVLEQPECIKVADGVYETCLPSLVTPRSVVPGLGHSKRIRYAILEVGSPSSQLACAITEHYQWSPLLDSSNMEMHGAHLPHTSLDVSCSPSLPSTDWIRIAGEIELNYPSFDAFVVLHGTDTMSYTSSALSFLLEDLGKTVVCLTSIL